MAATVRDKFGPFAKSKKSGIKPKSKALGKLNLDHAYHLRAVPDAEIRTEVQLGEKRMENCRVFSVTKFACVQAVQIWSCAPYNGQGRW